MVPENYNISLTTIHTTILKNGLWSLSMLLFNGFNKIWIEFIKIFKNWFKYTQQMRFWTFRSEFQKILTCWQKLMPDSCSAYKSMRKWEKTSLVPETHIAYIWIHHVTKLRWSFDLARFNRKRLNGDFFPSSLLLRG